MTLRFLVTAICVVSAACTRAPEGVASVDNSEPAAADAPTNRVAIPATVRRNLGITFAQVEARQVAQTIRVPGAFELEPRARREYRMALPGRVELLVDQYDRVEAGQALFRYRSPAWPELLHEIILGEQSMETARSEIEVGQAALAEARKRLLLARERVAGLDEARFKNADLEFQAAELEASLPRLAAELRLAETRLSNAGRTREHALHRAATAADIPEAELMVEVLVDGELVSAYTTIEWIDVRAVEGGLVELLAITDGAFVEAPTVVLTLVDPERVRFRAVALQADLLKLIQAAEARIVPPVSPGTPIDTGVAATMAMGLEANPDERTVILVAKPADPGDTGPRPGWMRAGVSAFLEVVIKSTEGPALAIPRSAVVRDGLTHVLFRRDPADPNQAIRVEADLGISDGRWVVLNSGVMRGDEVVLDGVYELKLATQQSGASTEGGHFHADGSHHDEH
ncbi:MAG: hypothetical protein ACI8QZ_000366 [Chlamydiales bacterium]|jgi:hypothetical protein